MSRVLLDENVLVGLRALLVGHEVFSTEYSGWKGLANGRLLKAAEAAQFEVFITADQNLRFQQRMVGRTLAMIILSSTNWNDIKSVAETIKDAVERVEVGVVLPVQVPGASDRREESR